MSNTTNSRRRVRTVFIMLAIHVLIGASSEAAVVANFIFTPSNPVAGQPVQFTDTSTGNPTIWQWDFENPPNGIDSTLQNPTWIFPYPGIYLVHLIVSIPPVDIDDIIITIVVVDPDPGELRFPTSSAQVYEDIGNYAIPVQRVGGSGGAVSVHCRTMSSGTATAGSDYTPINTTLSWANGDTADKFCTLPIIDDTLVESSETVLLSLANPTGGATLGTPSTATLTIIDNDVSGELSFSTSSYQVDEDVGAAAVTVRRTGGSDGALSVRCSTADGTAQAGSDYTATADILSWANGDTSSKFCTIPITDDTIEEGNETINLSLTNFTGGAVPGSPSTATLTILDNDTSDPSGPGELSFLMSSYQVNENAGIASIAVRRTGGSYGAVSVRCRTVSGGTATAGSDYTAIDTMLSWANGDTANKMCTIPIIDDTLGESNETVILSLANPTGGATLGTPSTATLTILGDDIPGELSFSTSSYQVAEDIGTAAIAVRRAGGSEGAVSVRCSTANGTAQAGQDYTATMDTLSWANGDTANKLCTIPIIDDTDAEDPETISLSLANFTGGAGPGSLTTAVLTIIDNDGCVADELNLCLNGGRFKVRIHWRDFEDQTGDGRTVPFGSDDSGLFWFFAPDNWEILVKVLDGCGVNDHVWVFAAATTNVEYTLEVTDTVTGEVGEYRNPLGNQAAAIIDTSAFASCPLAQRTLQKPGAVTFSREIRNPE